MKKLISLLLLAFTLPALAQEESVPVQNNDTKVAKEKKAKEPKTPKATAEASEKGFLPVAGEHAIGFTLKPLADYVGNIFNGNTANTLGNLSGEGILSTAFTGSATSIMGKYMFTDKNALRVNVGFNVTNMTEHSNVQDDKEVFLNPLSQAEVEDVVKGTIHNGSIAVGMEHRMGSHRIQGVFSANVFYGFATQKNTFSYGNAITELNQNPTISDPAVLTSFDGIPAARPTKMISTTPLHAFGVVGSAGVEFFIARDLSLGAEVNIPILRAWESQSYTEYEGFNTVSNKVENYTDVDNDRDKYFIFGTEHLGANLYINFYF